MENKVRLINANEIPWCNYDLDNYHSFVGVEKEYIDDMPTVDPEDFRLKGQWIMKENMIRSPYAKNAYCSECLWETAYSHNYCPNCGAKMET